MSSLSLVSLTYAAQEVNIYLRSIILIFGVTSNILNIIVFLSLEIFRDSSCAFYLLVMSFVSIIQIFFGLFARTLNVAFSVDWSTTSLTYCKLRYYFFQVCSAMFYTCIALATIDQYLATCSSPFLQRFSNIKLARWLFVIFTIIWIMHGIPILYYYNQDISNSTNATICTITNDTFQQYYSYFTLIILLCSMPVIITVLFGILAYRNVQHLTYRTMPLVRRETDKQLTIMVLVQDVYNLFFIIPYIVVYALQLNLNINLDPNYAAQIELALSITGALYYVPFSSAFYIYVCVSERFRRQFLYVLFKLHLGRCRQDFARNQILPDT
ncbi:unnamed protein product [Adineta steineri]|uniref:G-protein coupled receptors family 1 profile domain-containing protein n=1 Tax=Adineta steineri TaxID=433720 RepID=A0A818XQA2_9BILA|nr:unnamed protein product [Adineta steineri]CAF3740666.1 unnamed protein product [Adineta steineri]